MTSAKLFPRAWLVVGLLWFVGLLNYLDRVMLTTMRGSLVEAIPMTDAQFGLLTSVFLWVYAALSPFAGFLADRFSRTKVIVVSLLSWSVVTWLTGFATTYGELLATRALMGVTEACYIPAALALITDYHRGDTRSRAEGIHISGIMLGSGLGGLGGWIAQHYGWAHAFTIFGLVGIGYTVIVALLMRDAPREHVSGPIVTRLPDIRFGAAITSLFTNSAFILALAYWGLLGLAGWAVLGWMPTYMTENFNLSQGAAGLSATGYLQASMLVGVLVGGFLSDRWYRTNSNSRIYVPFIGLCLAVPSMLMAVNTPVLAIAIAGLVGYGLTRAFVDSNMMPILCMVTDPRYRATGYGVLNFCATGIGGCAIYIGGALRDANVALGKIFVFAALSLLVCAGLLLAIKAAIKNKPEAHPL
jgi:Sugar phosphate permease